MVLRLLPLSCGRKTPPPPLPHLRILHMTHSHSIATQSHYEGHSASSYESAYFYDSKGAYMDYLCSLVRDRLGIDESQQTRRLLDIGGGTGNFTRRLVEGAPHVQAVVVDPFLEFPSLQEDRDQQVSFIKASAEQFTSPRTKEEWWRTSYSQVLMKEVIHHLEAKDRVRIFRVMQQELQPIDKNPKLPSLLIITRPQYDHDYPLWSEARQIWAENQPSLEAIEKELKEAGFRHTEHSIEAYSCSIAMDRWLAMIKARFWSTFSDFADQELEEACQRITRDEAYRVDEKGDIHFEDRLVFITASN